MAAGGSTGRSPVAMYPSRDMLGARISAQGRGLVSELSEQNGGVSVAQGSVAQIDGL